MKFCDRHYRKDGSSVIAVETVFFGDPQSAYECFDLCASCAGALKDFINNPAPQPTQEEKRGPGRPSKTIANSEKKSA